MTRQPLRFLEETLGIPFLSLKGDERLRDVPAWDSMATLLFLTMVDRNFGIRLPARQVVRCQTVAELLALLGDASSPAA